LRHPATASFALALKHQTLSCLPTLALSRVANMDSTDNDKYEVKEIIGIYTSSNPSRAPLMSLFKVVVRSESFAKFVGNKMAM
jgi:hypothetical protein